MRVAFRRPVAPAPLLSAIASSSTASSRFIRPPLRCCRSHAFRVLATAQRRPEEHETSEAAHAVRPPLDADAACQSAPSSSGRSADAASSQCHPAHSLGALRKLQDLAVGAWTGRAGLTLLAAGGLFSGLQLDRFTGSGSTLQALGILAAIVTIHECGHFVAARAQNIHVKEFSIGFGPKLLGFKGAEVDYSLRAILLGGYVAFPDDDPDLQYPADDPDLLRNRPIRDRAIVISAGVIANVIFAWSILFVQASTIGMAIPRYEAGVRVPEVVSTSVAARAGLRAGDVIVSIGRNEIPASPSAVSRVVNAIMDSPEHSMDLGVRRKGEVVHVAVTPALGADGSGRIGVQLASNLKFTHSQAKNAADATRAASIQLARCFGIVLGGLWQLVSNVTGAAGSLSGPVAIVKVGADAAKADVAGLYQFAALVNINLAVTNILPLPALDGGALAFLIVESVRGGKKLPKVLEQSIMAGGLVLLMGLGVVLIVRDTLHLGGLG